MSGVLPRALREEIEKANAIEHFSANGQALRRIEEKVDLLLQREDPPKRLLLPRIFRRA